MAALKKIYSGLKEKKDDEVKNTPSSRLKV